MIWGENPLFSGTSMSFRKLPSLAWNETPTKQEHHWRWTPWGARWLEAWPKTYRSETWLPKNMEMLGRLTRLGFLDDSFKRCVGFLPIYLGILGLDNPNLNLRIFFQTNGSLNHLTYFPSVDLWVMFRQESLNYPCWGDQRSNFMQTYRKF